MNEKEILKEIYNNYHIQYGGVNQEYYDFVNFEEFKKHFNNKN